MSEYAMSLDYDLQLYSRIVAERTRDAQDRLDIEKYLTAAPRILDPQQALSCGMIHAVEPPKLTGECISSVIHS
jgi:ATP-dependent protease ClpP protease subunit